MTPLLELAGVSVAYRSAVGRSVTALDDVSFDVRAGETVGLVGGSGAGKSTVAHVVAGLRRPDSGTVRIDGRDQASLTRRRRAAARRRVHLVFQDPYTSLAPHLRVSGLVGEPLVIAGIPRAERGRRVLGALAEVTLDPAQDYASRHPHQLSGGERQRVALARALVERPALIVADEPTAMLDASVRADLLSLLSRLQAVHAMALLFITHDLALAESFCHRLVVLAEGRVVETGETRQVLQAPAHPYTAALVGAVRRLHS